MRNFGTIRSFIRSGPGRVGLLVHQSDVDPSDRRWLLVIKYWPLLALEGRDLGEWLPCSGILRSIGSTY